MHDEQRVDASLRARAILRKVTQAFQPVPRPRDGLKARITLHSRPPQRAADGLGKSLSIAALGFRHCARFPRSRVRFLRSAMLQNNTFSEDVDFGEAVFQDGLNFQMTLFVERAVFEGAQFTGEVILSEVHAKHLKKFNASAACPDGAVLESAELWENNRIEGFSLRGAKSAGTFRCDSANARACYSLLHSFSKPSFGTRAMNFPVCSPSRADSVTFRNSYQNENLSARVS